MNQESWLFFIWNKIYQTFFYIRLSFIKSYPAEVVWRSCQWFGGHKGNSSLHYELMTCQGNLLHFSVQCTESTSFSNHRTTLDFVGSPDLSAKAVLLRLFDVDGQHFRGPVVVNINSHRLNSSHYRPIKM